VDFVPDPRLPRKSGSAGNRTLASGSVELTEFNVMIFPNKDLGGLGWDDVDWIGLAQE
jgi:hypothetical protein